jgi:hypothetical protein
LNGINYAYSSLHQTPSENRKVLYQNQILSKSCNDRFAESIEDKPCYGVPFRGNNMGDTSVTREGREVFIIPVTIAGVWKEL